MCIVISRFLILLLPTNIIETSDKHHLQVSVKNENCYKISKHIFCHEAKQIENNFYFIHLIDSNVKLSNDFREQMSLNHFLKDYVQLNILNLVNNLSVKFLFPDSINSAKLQTFQGDLCLNAMCSMTTPVGATVISKNIKENSVHISSNMFEEIMVKPLNDIISTEDMYARISKLLINRSNFNVIQEIKSVLDSAKQIIGKIDITTDKMNDIHGFITTMQNKTEKDSESILIEYFGGIKDGKNIYVIGELEILFRISIFLMLFIAVFSFNIYFCGSIAYSLYKRDFISLDN